MLTLNKNGTIIYRLGLNKKCEKMREVNKPLFFYTINYIGGGGMAKTRFISDTQTENGLEYLKTLNDQLRNKPKELTKKQQQQIIQVYKNAYMDIINRNIKSAYGNSKEVKNLTAAYSQQIYEELQKVMKKYNNQTATDMANINKQMMKLLMGDGYQQIKDQVDKLVDIVNADTVEQIIRGKVYEDGKGLDKRLWKSVSSSGEKIEDAVASCTAEGMGAAEMAENLKQFAMGGHHTWSRNKIREKLGSGYARKYSGGLDYESLRLARTTITHQAQVETINTKRVNPYMGGIKWHSNHEAGRTCDLCNSRDGHIFIVDKEDVPLDHPNGACWLEPVWMINGKEATPEEIAKDMKAWANGEPNSGAMDKIPEYKGLGGRKQPVEPVKPIKPVKKTVKPATPKKQTVKKQTIEKQTPTAAFNKLTEQQLQEYKDAFLKHGMKKRADVKYLKEAAEAMLNDFPAHFQQAYYRMSKGIKGFWETSKDEAYYTNGSKIISMNCNKELKNVEKYKYYKFAVWFHETGHAMDNLLTLDSNGRTTGRLSYDKEFQQALINDYAAIKKKLVKQKYPDMSDAEIARTFTDEKSYAKLFYSDLAKNHKTKGIQDVIDGLSNSDCRVMWGHGKKYWNRSGTEEGRMNEIASEAWANICEAHGDKETLEYVNKYFPTATKRLNEIIKNKLKELK